MKAVQTVPQRSVRLRVQMPIAVQGEAHRGVPGACGDLFRTGSGGDPQRDRRVPKVMDAQPLQPGGSRCWSPDPGAEVRGAERGTVGEGEHEAIRLGRPDGQMFLERLDHDPR